MIPPTHSESGKPIAYNPPSVLSSIGYNARSIDDILKGNATLKRKRGVKKLTSKKLIRSDPIGTSDASAAASLLIGAFQVILFTLSF